VTATRFAAVTLTSGPGREAASDSETGAAGRETGGATTYNNPAFVIRSVTFCASNVEVFTMGACNSFSGTRSGIALATSSKDA
jgi:hypothetical protein